MSRGNARQRICRDDADRQNLLDGLEDTVVRYGWELFAFVVMPNHIHLNPVRGKRPLVSHPRDWPWSSYPGYGNQRKRLPWVSYDVVLDSWQGGVGGSDPAAGYRRYVEPGIKVPPESPFVQAAHGWLLGGKEFVDRVRREMNTPRFADEVPRARSLGAVDVDSVFAAVADYYDVELALLSIRSERHIGRAVAAWLARRMTTATLRELSDPLGLGRPESVSNLTRRIDRDLPKNNKLRQTIQAIEKRILRQIKTTNKG